MYLYVGTPDGVLVGVLLGDTPGVLVGVLLIDKLGVLDGVLLIEILGVLVGVLDNDGVGDTLPQFKTSNIIPSDNICTANFVPLFI